MNKRVVVYCYEKNGKKVYMFVPSKYNRKNGKHSMIDSGPRIAVNGEDYNKICASLEKAFERCIIK